MCIYIILLVNASCSNPYAGDELLHLQGLQLDPETSCQLTDAQKRDLAGNS